MVEATKKKPKRKSRVYTEEEKAVLVNRLKVARERKAEKLQQLKKPVEILKPITEVVKQEAKIEKVEQQIEKEAMKETPNVDMIAKLMDKFTSLESKLNEKLEAKIQQPEPVAKNLPDPPPTLPIAKPEITIRDYIGLRRL